jgi:hypothetical protein
MRAGKIEIILERVNPFFSFHPQGNSSSWKMEWELFGDSLDRIENN